MTNEVPAFEPVKKTDQELIAEWGKEGQVFQDSSALFATKFFREHKKDFQKITIDPNLYDIGGGRHGLHVAKDILSNDVGIKHVTLVEPYATAREIYEGLNPDELKKNFSHAPVDGLSFLLDNKMNPANVMVCSLDKDVVGSNQYLVRMTEEIYNIVPLDGIFVCVNSNEIESQAEKLFPYKRKFDNVVVFSKNDLFSKAKEGLSLVINDCLNRVKQVLDSQVYISADKSDWDFDFADFGHLSHLYKELNTLFSVISGNTSEDTERIIRNTVIQIEGLINIREQSYDEGDDHDNFAMIKDLNIRQIWIDIKKMIHDNYSV